MRNLFSSFYFWSIVSTISHHGIFAITEASCDIDSLTVQYWEPLTEEYPDCFISKKTDGYLSIDKVEKILKPIRSGSVAKML